MEKDLISDLTGTFKNIEQETQFIHAAWPQYALSLRSPLLFLAAFILLGGYLDYTWYGFSAHFYVFEVIRIVTAGAVFLLSRQTFRTKKMAHFDLGIAIVQLLILFLWFAIFYDRTFFNNEGITSESFFTVLFVTYPLLVFYVIRGNIFYSFINSILALLTYVACVMLHPEAEVKFRLTEMLVFTFFIYYSFVLQRQLNTEERKRYSGEQKQKEALSLAKKESEEKTRFIAATSHDLRQPLHALSLYMDILEKSPINSGDSRDFVKHAKASVTSLNELLIALLDISKLDAGAVDFNVKHFQLDKLLEKIFITYKSVAENKGLILRLHNHPFVVNTDAVMLERALGNLVNNAIQHSKNGKILIACRKKGQSASIEVWDQGPGIPEQDLEDIFTEYHQLSNTESQRRSGLGLGLAIVKRIDSALGFNLEVKSRVGKGSKFSLSVPAGESINIEPAVDISDIGSLRLTNKKIMIVDDDVEVRHAMKMLMESWGCQTIVAASHQDLFNKISLDEIPDAIISDLNLPDNINGEILIKNIREYFSLPIPALLVTGNTKPRQNEFSGDSEMMLLYKPLQAAQLRLALSRLV
jgi:signal transduction histidine kinase/CheY-like chemotaxis protein